jgi:nucleotide-binding universal stress UspA family protein
MTEKVGKRIVVGVDGSLPSERAVRWALEQAELTGARVDAVHAWQVPVGDGWVRTGDVVDVLTKAGEQVVADAVAAATDEHPGAVVVTRVVEGLPAAVLLDAAEGADLLVLGCHGQGGFTGALLDSVTQRCVQHARCPVVIVRGSVW